MKVQKIKAYIQGQFWKRWATKAREKMGIWTEKHAYKIFINYVVITDSQSGDFVAF